MKGILKKLNIVLIAINALILIIALWAVLSITSIRNDTASDKARSVWQNEKLKYSQISLFISPDSGLDTMSIYALRKSIDDKLEKAIPEEDKGKGRLWIDCGSCEKPLSLSAVQGSCDVTASGTFGDYFVFHPEKLLSGSLYTDMDTNLDQIVIDKDCSWKLFGSVETAGLPVNIGDRVFYVAAVIETPDNELYEKVYGETPRIYMPFETLRTIDKSMTVNVYEAVLPNIMKNYAHTLMTEACPVSSDKSIIIDQTNRFGLINLRNGYKNIGESVMITSPMAFPWFENISRSGELRARLIAGPVGNLLIIPMVSTVYVIFMLTKLGGKGIKKIRATAEEKYQKKISEMYHKARKDK